MSNDVYANMFAGENPWEIAQYAMMLTGGNMMGYPKGFAPRTIFGGQAGANLHNRYQNQRYSMGAMPAIRDAMFMDASAGADTIGVLVRKLGVNLTPDQEQMLHYVAQQFMMYGPQVAQMLLQQTGLDQKLPPHTVQNFFNALRGTRGSAASLAMSMSQALSTRAMGSDAANLISNYVNSHYGSQYDRQLVQGLSGDEMGGLIGALAQRGRFGVTNQMLSASGQLQHLGRMGTPPKLTSEQINRFATGQAQIAMTRDYGAMSRAPSAATVTEEIKAMNFGDSTKERIAASIRASGVTDQNTINLLTERSYFEESLREKMPEFSYNTDTRVMLGAIRSNKNLSKTDKDYFERRVNWFDKEFGDQLKSLMADMTDLQAEGMPEVWNELMTANKRRVQLFDSVQGSITSLSEADRREYEEVSATVNRLMNDPKLARIVSDVTAKSQFHERTDPYARALRAFKEGVASNTAMADMLGVSEDQALTFMNQVTGNGVAQMTGTQLASAVRRTMVGAAMTGTGGQELLSRVAYATNVAQSNGYKLDASAYTGMHNYVDSTILAANAMQADMPGFVYDRTAMSQRAIDTYVHGADSLEARSLSAMTAIAGEMSDDDVANLEDPWLKRVMTDIKSGRSIAPDDLMKLTREYNTIAASLGVPNADVLRTDDALHKYMLNENSWIMSSVTRSIGAQDAANLEDIMMQQQAGYSNQAAREEMVSFINSNKELMLAGRKGVDALAAFEKKFGRKSELSAFEVGDILTRGRSSLQSMGITAEDLIVQDQQAAIEGAMGIMAKMESLAPVLRGKGGAAMFQKMLDTPDARLSDLLKQFFGAEGMDAHMLGALLGDDGTMAGLAMASANNWGADVDADVWDSVQDVLGYINEKGIHEDALKKLKEDPKAYMEHYNRVNAEKIKKGELKAKTEEQVVYEITNLSKAMRQQRAKNQQGVGVSDEEMAQINYWLDLAETSAPGSEDAIAADKGLKNILDPKLDSAKDALGIPEGKTEHGVAKTESGDGVDAAGTGVAATGTSPAPGAVPGKGEFEVVLTKDQVLVVTTKDNNTQSV